MRLLDITFQNLRRRSGKAVLVVTCLTVAIAMVTAMVISNRALQASISSKMDDYGADIVVVPKSDQLPLTYGGMALPGVTTVVPEFDLSVLDRIDATSVSPKLVGSLDVEGRQMLLVGVDFASELGMKKWWHLNGRKPVASSDVLLGSSMASELGKKPGESITVAGVVLYVAAVLMPTGSSEDDVIMADLGTTQTIMGRPGKITFAEVSAPTGASIDDLAAQISRAIPEARVTAIKQVIESKKQVMERFSVFGMGLSVLVLVASGFSMLTMMMSSVNQRTREIGILRAVGYRRRHISIVVMSEALFMSVAGGVVGIALGSALGRLIAVRLLDVVSVSIGAKTVVSLVLLAVVIGMASASLPASRAASIDPAKALQFI